MRNRKEEEAQCLKNMKNRRKKATALILAAVLCALPAAAAAEELILPTWDEMLAKYTTPVMDAAFPVTTSEQYTWQSVSEQAAREQVTVAGYAADGVLLSQEEWGELRICTGQTGIAIQETARKYVLFALIIQGDVLGTGRLSIAQLVRLAKAVTGAEPLEGVYAQAGDINENGSPDIADLATLASWLTGSGPRGTDILGAFFMGF